MPTKKQEAQAESQAAPAEDKLVAPPSPDSVDYELKAVKDSPIPGHQEQVLKGE